jgi:hypothetical protein
MQVKHQLIWIVTYGFVSLENHNISFYKINGEIESQSINCHVLLSQAAFHTSPSCIHNAPAYVAIQPAQTLIWNKV